jgi:putative transposase
VTAYIDEYKQLFGVEPICRTLQVAPSTYYAARARPPAPRTVRDEALKPLIAKVHAENYGVYGARKVWKALLRQGVDVGRDRVARLMLVLGICGVVRGKARRTTTPDPAAARAPDLVNRDFTASRPNEKWVADFSEVATWAGRVYVAFVIDLFSRMIVGWRMATTMRTELVLDALEMAVWRRSCVLEGLVAHSDAGSQYTSIRYTERLAEIGAAPSIGSVGDPIDNAVSESVIGLYKTELIRRRGPWRTPDDVELATLEYVDWFNNRRLHSTIHDLPPAEYEAIWMALGAAAVDVTENQPQNRALRPATDRGGTGDRATHSAFASSATVGAEGNYADVVVPAGDGEGVLSTNINPGG